MIIIAGSGRRRATDPTMTWPSQALPIEGDTTPYDMPSMAPWRAPEPAITPTPDGTGAATHPSVVDFYDNPWNGYRFWMAMTPYYRDNTQLENPCILASHDGYTWVVPDGLTNPIYPWQGVGYNSDTDLCFDPESGRLVCVWRALDGTYGPNHTLAKCSTDGVSWTAAVELVSPPFLSVSPCIVRRGPRDWWLFAANRNTNGAYGLDVHRSADPLTGWSASTVVPFGDLADVWHLDVMWDGSAFRAITVNALSPYDMYAATSTNGYVWTSSSLPVATGGGGWDAKLYRPTLTVKDDERFRVWYGATNGNWRIGYTEMPRSLWPAP